MASRFQLRATRGRPRLGVKALSFAAVGMLTAGLTAPSLAAQAATAAPLTLAGYGSPTFQRNFNPYGIINSLGGNQIFETLYVINPIEGKNIPWLATGFQWSNGARTLTFTIRQGVKWNDGRPFSAQDVAFTFNLLKKYPPLDLNGVWKVLKSVSAHGQQVVFQFKTRNVTYFQYIAQTPIVPAFQWSKVANPLTFTDPTPIGTGPFMLKSFNPSEYTLKPNPYYWQRSKIKIPQIDVKVLTTNTISDLEVGQGVFDEVGLFIPDIQKLYVDKNPKEFHYWFPQNSPQSLDMNLTEYPFNQLKFREAMAYAINRKLISTQADYGEMPPANQSGLAPSQQSRWLDKALLKKYQYRYDPKKAAALLASMGLRKNAHGQLVGKNGKPLAFTMGVISGYTNTVATCQIIAKELGQLGIKVTVEPTSVSTFVSNQDSGKYDMWVNTGTSLQSSPWYVYNTLLNSNLTAPVGKLATGDQERWINARTDALLAAFGKTPNSTQQHAIINQIEKIMFTQLPVIDTIYGQGWNEYTTVHYVGWPTKNNPYADAMSYPNDLVTLTHLRPK